jgi:hypothetical protein
MNFKEDDLLKLSRILEEMIKHPSKNKSFLIDNGVTSYKHYWIAVNFLTSDCLLIRDTLLFFYFIVPKVFAEKLLLLDSFENKKEIDFKGNYINKTWMKNKLVKTCSMPDYLKWNKE